MSENSMTYYYRLMFKAFADELDFHVLKGVVTEVDPATKNCVVKPDGDEPEFNDVKYAVNPDIEQGIILKPKVGSQVTIGVLEAIGGTQAAIVDMQEFEELVYDAGSDTVATAKRTADRIKILEDKVNDLYDLITTHVHIGVASGSSVSGVLSPTDILAVQAEKFTVNTKQSDIDYDKIKVP